MMRYVLLSYLLIATLESAPHSSAQENSPELESVLVYERQHAVGSSDFRMTDHRAFPRHDGGLLLTYRFPGTFMFPPSGIAAAYNSEGELQWQQSYTGRSPAVGGDAAVQLSNGDFVMAIGGSFAARRLDPTGHVLWHTNIFDALTGGSNGFEFEAAQALELGSDSILALGTQLPQTNGSAGTNSQIAFARVSTETGQVIWKTLAGGTLSEHGSALAELSDGTVVIGATTDSPQGDGKSEPHFGQTDIWILNYTLRGTKAWEGSFGGSDTETLHSIRTNAQGLVLFGTSRSGVSGNKTTANVGGDDIWVVQSDSAGRALRDFTYGTEADDRLFAVFALPDGGWLLHARHTRSSTETLLLCLNADLTERWRRLMPFAGVTATRSGEIRLLMPDGSLSMRQMLLAADGEVLVNQVIPMSYEFGLPYLQRLDYLVEKPSGGFLASNLRIAAHFSTITQPRGTPMISSFEGGGGGQPFVSIYTTFTNATIFYTTNKTQPTFASTRYTGGFTVSKPTEVRAIAYNADFSLSATNTAFIQAPHQVATLALDVNQGGGIGLEGMVRVGTTFTNVTEALTNEFPQQRQVEVDSLIRLTALPQQGSEFIRWEGATNSTNLVLDFLVEENSSLRAIFGTTVQTLGGDRGRLLVNGVPGPRVVEYGTHLIQAVPNPGYFFASWGAQATGSASPLLFEVTSPTPTVSAMFVALSPQQAAPLGLAFGPGTVTMSPSSHVYDAGTVVTFAATPKPGAAFLGWVGATNSRNPTLTMPVTGSERFLALFLGQTTNRFVAALPAMPGETASTSTNLVDWNPIPSQDTGLGVLLIEDAISSENRKFYRASRAAP